MLLWWPCTLEFLAALVGGSAGGENKRDWCVDLLWKGSRQDDLIRGVWCWRGTVSSV